MKPAAILRDGIGPSGPELVKCSRCSAGIDVELGEPVAGEPGVRSFTCPACLSTFGLYSSAWLGKGTA